MSIFSFSRVLGASSRACHCLQFSCFEPSHLSPNSAQKPQFGIILKIVDLHAKSSEISFKIYDPSILCLLSICIQLSFLFSPSSLHFFSNFPQDQPFRDLACVINSFTFISFLPYHHLQALPCCISSSSSFFLLHW